MAWRSSGMPGPGGYWLPRPARTASAAACRISSGPAGSGVMDLLATSFVVVRDAHVDFLARARGSVAEFVATGTVDADEYARGCAAARAGEPTELRSVAEVTDPDGKACLRVVFTT